MGLGGEQNKGSVSCSLHLSLLQSHIGKHRTNPEKGELKDKRLQELTEELNKVRADARRGFSIWEDESEAIAAWKKKHDTEVHGNPKQYHGASGGGYSYRFYPTGIGTLGQCVCLQCEKYALIKSEGDPKKYYKLLEERDGRLTFSEF